MWRTLDLQGCVAECCGESQSSISQSHSSPSSQSTPPCPPCDGIPPIYIYAVLSGFDVSSCWGEPPDGAVTNKPGAPYNCWCGTDDWLGFGVGDGHLYRHHAFCSGDKVNNTWKLSSSRTSRFNHSCCWDVPIGGSPSCYSIYACLLDGDYPVGINKGGADTFTASAAVQAAWAAAFSNPGNVRMAAFLHNRDVCATGAFTWVYLGPWRPKPFDCLSMNEDCTGTFCYVQSLSNICYDFFGGTDCPNFVASGDAGTCNNANYWCDMGDVLLHA